MPLPSVVRVQYVIPTHAVRASVSYFESLEKGHRQAVCVGSQVRTPGQHCCLEARTFWVQSRPFCVKFACSPCVWVSFRCSGLLPQSNSKQVWLTCTFTCKCTLTLSNPYHSQARLTPRSSLFRRCDRSAFCALSQLKELSVRTVRLHVHRHIAVAVCVRQTTWFTHSKHQ